MSSFRLANAPLFPEWATRASSKDEKLAPACMPPEWISDENMLGLFGPLDANVKNTLVQRQRESRLAFWRDLIISCFRTHPALASVDPILSESILKVLLRRNDLVPMGISAILNDLLQHKLIIPVNHILQPQSSTWWSKLMSFMSSVPEEEVQYVLIPAAEEQVRRVLGAIPKDRHLLPYEEFIALTQGVNMDILRPFMPMVTFFEVKDVKGVKVASNPSQAKVSDAERSLFHITNSIHQLERREEKYSGEVKRLRSEVLVKLKEGNRSAATLLLKRSKMYESHLSKAMQSRDTLLRISASIEEAQTSSAVFEAMKMGAETLKSENAKLGSVETVEALLDDVSELIEETNDISDAVMGSQQQLLSGSIDESELEKELAELAKEELSDLNLSKPVKPTPTIARAGSDTTNTTVNAPASSLDSLVSELEQLSVPTAPITSSSTSSSAMTHREQDRDPQGQAEPV